MSLYCIIIIIMYIAHPRYLEANAGCKHFDVHGGPENIPVSRFSFDAKVGIAGNYDLPKYYYLLGIRM